MLARARKTGQTPLEKTGIGDFIASNCGVEIMDLNDLKQLLKRRPDWNEFKQLMQNKPDLQQVLQLFKGKPKSNSRVGLMIQEDRLLLAHMDIRNNWPYVLHARAVALHSGYEIGQELHKLVKDLELEGEQVSYVLNPKDYYLHLVEAPNVQEDELRSAIRWKVKDLLDIKIDDAALDLFRVPENAYRGRDMVYVVATAKSKVRSIADLIEQAGMELAVIDIPELTMHNIARACLDDRGGVAFMDLRRTGSTMNISIDGELYLSRRINTQIEPDAMESEEWDALKDRLVLEIQRSMDYFESQMRRPPIKKIVIAQRQSDTSQLVKELDDMLSADVTALDLAECIKGAEPLTPEFQQSAFSAIGATLRGIDKPEGGFPIEDEPDETPDDEAEAA